MLAYLNGAYLPESAAKVSISDRGWLYGDAVFETMRTYGGRVFKLEEHLERLKRSAAAVGIKLPMEPGEMAAVVLELLERGSPGSDVAIRVALSRGIGGGGLWPKEELEPTLAVLLRELPTYSAEVFTTGWRMITAKTKRNSPESIDPRVKSANFLNNIMAKREAVDAGVDEALMLNHDGWVAESTVSNFFMIANGGLVTAPVEAGVLAGITREMVLELAAAAAISADEALFTVDDIYRADEAFITLTSAGLIPIVELDGRPIGTGRPGPIVGRLRRLYEEHVAAFEKGED